MHVQGAFPAKWKGQGEFVMPGFDSSFMWQGYIPEDETPFEYNPVRGFVSSANQRPVDSSYPYYLGREYPLARGVFLNKSLLASNDITMQDMMVLQLSDVDYFASITVPLLLKNIQHSNLKGDGNRFYNELQAWNFRDDANSNVPTLYHLIWKNFSDTIFNDEYALAPPNTKKPYESTLIEAVLRDSAYPFIDNIHTTHKESLQDMCTAAFNKAIEQCVDLEKRGILKWGHYKQTKIYHLLKLPMFSKLDLMVGGGDNTINAMKDDHGPSWRMIVGLTRSTEAYGIYPGGQSGNPGSRFYDNFIIPWANGSYYRLWLMTVDEKEDKRIKWEMHFNSI
jgi:penicillin amidase